MGAIIFLSVVGFVFLFVASSVSLFTAGAQNGTVAATRAADALAGGLLGAPSRPFVLNPDCTVRFFESLRDTTVPVSGCPYDAGGGSTAGERLASRLGLGAPRKTNVSLRTNVTGTTDGDGADLLCWNRSRNRLFERDTAGCTGDVVDLYAGPTADASVSSITARRVVSFDGRDLTLLVEVW